VEVYSQVETSDCFEKDIQIKKEILKLTFYRS
jgi:hypothetical protein